MLEQLADTVSRSGFAFIGEYAPELSTTDVAAELSLELGLPIMSEARALRPCEQESASPNTYSGNFGHNEFPLHTDLAHWIVPPRYLVLRCITGTMNVGTRLLDGHNLLDAIGRTVLSRSLVQPRRPIDRRRALLRLLDSRDGSAQFLRWDSLFIVPATRSSAMAFAAVREYVDSAAANELALAKPADTLVIDNWRMLHGRSRVDSASTARRIDRAYIDQLC
jgi:L-asparagine oxygenase